MKKIYVSIFTMLFSIVVYCQDLPTIVPPSPEASALAKFDMVPVSHFTGVPNINVSIYNINQDGISLPIGLSYHARGIQIGEVAPRVGLGWSLNFGGSLSRQVRGFEDEAPHGYISKMNSIKSSLTYDSSDPQSGESIRRGLLSQTTYNPTDITPDKFIFNANGLSGNFFLNYDDLNSVIQEYKDIKIEYFSGTEHFESFVITDNKGNKYYYGKSKDGSRAALNKDVTLFTATYSGLNGGGYNQYPGPSHGPYPNSWQLMDIETVNGSLISFDYDVEVIDFYRRSQDVYNPTSDPPTLESRFSKIRSHQWQIKEITFEKGKVKFLGGPFLRQDVTSSSGIPAKPLEKIQILDIDGNVIKQFLMNYEHKQALVDNNYLPYLNQIDTTASKRLFLNSITEQDSNGNSNPSQTFEYNNQQVPNRFSNSQDAWGYYNGMQNGHYLTFTEYNGNPINRTVDTIKSNVGLLEKINYPTGGSSEFTYEHNRGIPPSALKDVITTSINPLYSRSEGLTHLNYNENYNSSTKSYEEQFDVNYIYYGGSGGINATVVIGVPEGACGQNEPNQTNCNFSITLEGGSYTHQLYIGSNTINRSVLPPGQYILRVKPQNHVHDPTNWDHTFDVLLNWIEQEDSESDIVFGGGKRIKRIENKDSNGALVSFREYEYKTPSGITSGNIFGLPNYMSIDENQAFGGITVASFTGSSAGIPLQSLQGNTIGYEYVTEYFGDKNNNIGKTVFKFTDFEDSGDFHKYPYHIPTDNSWLRGKNLSTKIYGIDENNSYSLEKEVINDYLYADTPTPFDFFKGSQVIYIDNNIDIYNIYNKDKRKFSIPMMVFRYPVVEPLEYKVFSLTGGTQDLLKTTETDYHDGGNIEKITTYNYDYSRHYQLKGSETTNSRDEVIKTINYYPIDKNDITGLSSEALNAANKLQNKNRFEVIQTEVFKDNILQTQLRNNYKDWSGNVALENIEVKKSSQSLEDRIIYHKYDNKGNPVEVSKKDGSRVYYVWGYDKTQPIAKIEGYTCYTEIDPIKGEVEICFTEAQWLAISASVNASFQENTVASETNLRAKLQDLRNSFSSTTAQVTSFTYDPLIGVTSITDPRGETMYYQYDNFNRLEFVKDKEGNVLSKNEYNYKN